MKPKMKTYIYSRWKNAPAGSPIEFYSELDQDRFETRKVEIFNNGQATFASTKESTGDTRLGIIPVPSLEEIKSQQEFDIKPISADEFEMKWRQVVSR
jgi:hypothetical protein